MPSALPNLLQRLAWVAFLGCTAWLAAALPEQPVDAQNRSLKSPTSRDAERMRELAAVVPTDPVVLVAFTAPGDLELPADQRQQIAALTEQVRALPGVQAIAAAPVPDPGLAAYAVTVARDDELPTTGRVLAACCAGLPPGVGLHAAGLPNIDTLGVLGGDIHSDQEFAWPASFVERAQLSALILCKIASGEIDAVKLKALRLETM